MTKKHIVTLHADNPVAQLGHRAMATATLHLFLPSTYPTQLQLKYLKLAIFEVQKRILKHNFEVADLLHGISQIFLASVLVGDEIPTRAHLKAAKEPVDQRGGLDATCVPKAQALKYGDLHLAVETCVSTRLPDRPSRSPSVQMRQTFKHWCDCVETEYGDPQLYDAGSRVYIRAIGALLLYFCGVLRGSCPRMGWWTWPDRLGQARVDGYKFAVNIRHPAQNAKVKGSYFNYGLGGRLPHSHPLDPIAPLPWKQLCR